jgi:hypothetical protein
LGIWTAEGMCLPIEAGQTYIATIVSYAFIYVALFIGAAGSVWSVDAALQGRGRFLT